MKKTLYTLKRAVVGVFGVLVATIGIILIPLPGPGLLIVLAGLLILSIEFEWARRQRDKVKRHLDDIIKHK